MVVTDMQTVTHTMFHLIIDTGSRKLGVTPEGGRRAGAAVGEEAMAFGQGEKHSSSAEKCFNCKVQYRPSNQLPGISDGWLDSLI